MNFLESDGWMSGVIYGVAAIIVLYLWVSDVRSKNTKGFPGATLAPVRVLVIAGVGGLVLTLAETLGENLLGLTAEQSELAVIAIIPLLAAAVIEELVFRGYLVVQDKGKAWLVGSTVGFSFLFAIIHPYVWEWEEGRLSVELTTKGIFSTAFIFLNSLWFYAVRFSIGNKTNSLLPCFVAHGVSNFSVWAIKGYQGFLTW